MLIPVNFKSFFKPSEQTYFFLTNQKFSFSNNNLFEDNKEYQDSERQAMPMSPIFGYKIKNYRPPLPKYLSWEEINSIYNR